MIGYYICMTLSSPAGSLVASYSRKQQYRVKASDRNDALNKAIAAASADGFEHVLVSTIEIDRDQVEGENEQH